jgi:Uma2 family endonuclease
MSSTALVSIEEYLRRTEKPNCEYVDGVLHPKAMPTTLHAILQYALLMLLRRQGALALPELTVRVSGTTFLVPDVAVVRDIQVPYPMDPALLCVEILSPDDRVGMMLAKCEQYHAWGVPYCWVIDPEKQTAWEYAKDGEPERLDRSGVLRAGAWTVRLDELFAELPRP